MALANKIVQDDKLKEAINNLIIAKRAGNELHWELKIPEISDLIDNEIIRLKDKLHIMKRRGKVNTEKLNNLFRSALTEVWG